MTSLIPLGPDLWTVEGPRIRGAAGFDFPTRMCLARLSDGTLWVHSPVALTPDLSDALAQIGPVGHLVAPNDLHHRFLLTWAATYPDALIHATPGVAGKCPGVTVDHTLRATPTPDWADCFDQVYFDRNIITPEAVFFHRASGTAIFTDLLQQMPSGWYSGIRAAVARIDLMTGDHPAVPRKFRAAFRNRRALRAAIAQVTRWPVEKLVMAHGPVVDTDAAKALTRAFAWAG